MTKNEPDYRKLSEELDVLLAKLQQSDVQVDEAMELYEQGLGLIGQLEKHLEHAENELVRLKVQTKADS